MSREEESLFSDLDPHDGFQIHRIDINNEVSMHLVCKYKNEVVNLGTISDKPEDASKELVAWVNPTAAQLGDCARLEMVLEAVARFMTTGGSLTDLEYVISRMKSMASSGLLLIGWHYHEGEQIYDPDLDRIVTQHIFVSNMDQGERTKAVVWVEDVFIEEKTLGQILQERQDYEESDEYGRRIAQRRRAIQLLDSEDLDSEESSDRDPEV